jgi:hypothetical protein
LPLRWSHPIWTSVAEALSETTFGHLTIDVGRTTQSLVATLAALTTMIMTIVVSRDRRRAELILLATSAVTTLLSVTVLVQRLLPASAAVTIPPGPAIAFTGLGAILNLAAIFLAFERRETRRKEAAHYLPIEIASAAALLVNISALYVVSDVTQQISAGFGLAVLLLLVTIRRLALSRWGAAALCTTALVGAGVAAVWLFGKNAEASGLLRFVPAPGANTLSILQRLLADVQWSGSGAGTFDLLARIYQSGEAGPRFEAPTLAIALVAETGWTGILAFTLIGFVLFIKLFSGALDRGRDWFFPAAGAASVATALSGSLVTQGLTQLPVTLTFSIIVGVGLSQGFSQTNRV